MTKRDYAQLSQLSLKYDDLVIVAQPCNQFGYQEPKFGELLFHQIMTDPKMKPKGNWHFMARAKVNGRLATPLYKWLKAYKLANPKHYFNGKVHWNFEKFLIGRDGKPLARYHKYQAPLTMEHDIRVALGIKGAAATNTAQMINIHNTGLSSLFGH